ncbi:proline dehydrogenase 1, mitochondrial-like [Wolffia australiana]
MAVARKLLPSKIPPVFLRASSTLSSSSPSSFSSPSASSSLDLENTEKLFASAHSWTLLKTLTALQCLAVEPAVDLSMAAIHSRISQQSPMARALVMAAIKATAYRQFCAGEDLAEATKTLQKLWADGLRGILDYGLEDAEDDVSCDANLAEFLNTIAMTSLLPPSSVSFACVKITAICPVSLLERVSDLLRWETKNSSATYPWRRHHFPVLSAASPVHHTAVPPLTQAEEQGLNRAHDRLSDLCEKCAERDLPLLVDAEYTAVQPAIDYVAFSAAATYNRGGAPLVYTTVQAYLKDSEERLRLAAEAAEKEGVSVGIKLVRGAYMAREAAAAAARGAPSPVHESIEETHRCYDRCAMFALQKAARGGAAVVLATHNVESGKVAAAKADELGIGRGNARVQFAQLKGMAEGLSLGLRNAGFQVSKYLPFGPVHKVIPYLLRRAQENRGFLSSSSVDRHLISKELKRRLASAVLGR